MTTVTKKKTKTDKLAVIKTGGKQYLVAEGDSIKIEKLSGKKEIKAGDKISFDEVLMIANGDKVDMGTPNISKAKVEGEVVEVALNKKVTVIRYRSKSRHFIKKGHRQPFVKVKITKI